MAQATWIAWKRRSYAQSLRHDHRRELERAEMYRLVRIVFGVGPEIEAEREAARRQVKAAEKRQVAREKAARKRMDKAASAAVKARAVDTLDLIRRQGRIDRRQYSAGTMYRDAWVEAGGGTRCTLNQDGGRTGGGTISGPTPAAMRGAQLLSQARILLGEIDDSIVRLVVVEGQSIRAVAARVFERDDRLHLEHCGHRLRLALERLAGRWIPMGRGRAGGFRSDDTGTASATAGVIEQMPVAHASHRSVYMSSRRVA